MTSPEVRRGALTTGEGTNTGSFDPGDWALALTVAAIWGSSFLWIAIGLDALAPTAVAFLRLALGAGTLWMFGPTRVQVPRQAWPGIAVVAIAGNAGPALLFAFAQQRVASSVAGMINGATPLATLAVYSLLSGRSPGRRQLVGLFVGFAGVVLIASPNLLGADAQPLGVFLLVAAVLGYGVANNTMLSLQQSHGSPPVMGRALLLASVLTAPLGIVGLASSDPTAASIVAVGILGVVGTGVARSMNASLIGRTGPARAALVAYLIPVVAIILGVTVRHETIGPLELIGTVTILLGASLISRRQR